MYILKIIFDNASCNGSGQFCLSEKTAALPKWTVLDGGEAGQEMLRLMTSAFGGKALLPHIPFDFKCLLRDRSTPLVSEVLYARHPPYEIRPGDQPLVRSGFKISEIGKIEGLKKRESRFPDNGIPFSTMKTGMGLSCHFLLGYGPEFETHDGTDDFDFTSPFFRTGRFQSIFNPGAALTDAVEFLARLHRRAIIHKRLAAHTVLERLRGLIETHFGIDTGGWMDASFDFRRELPALRPVKRKLLAPVIDTARHVIDAFPRRLYPLDMPFPVLFNRPDLFYTGDSWVKWAFLIDRMLPGAQFIITLDPAHKHAFPATLSEKRFEINEPPKPAPGHGRQKGAVLLVDIDGVLPNLALMKLSRYFKEQGRRVILGRKTAFIKDVEAVFGSCTFSRPASFARIAGMKKFYGQAFSVGGSGVDLETRLPAEIENLPADYTLYPELEDRAIGFLTRGCPFHCPFCVVPVKEGHTRQVSTLDDLLGKNRGKLILLDDNLLALPGAEELLREMVSRGIMVNFNQTLDLRMMNREKAKLLRKIKCSNLRFTRGNYHFSLNNACRLDGIREKYGLLDFQPGDNVEFICMYGFDTTLSDDLERFRFLRTLPGAYVFPQRYRRFPGGPPPELSGFFDEDADKRIDELVGIVFKQNMKAMEKYYRWLSRRYAMEFGRLHGRLVDTLFRYNHREEKGLYIATLAGLKKDQALSFK